MARSNVQTVRGRVIAFAAMPSAEPVGHVTLNFDPNHLIVGDDTDIRQGLSAVALHGGTGWLACDEGCRLERLTHTPTSATLSDHRVIALDTLLSLPAASTEEADIEGMDVDDGWLWLVSSHSVKRKKPKNDDSAQAVADKLARTSRDGNRHLLGRIPLNGNSPQREHNGRRAATVRATADSSELLDAIRSADSNGDRHLAPFVNTAGKDNGLDIEGLAVRDMRAYVGLRGPVLREWCCVLELRLEAAHDVLRLSALDGAVPYRKHFLKLNGLGVRDLVMRGDDLLVLAGPAMAHDGPHEIWRWKNGARSGATPAAGDVTRLLTLPQREAVDRAEGLAIFDESGGRTTVLVVYDTPAPERMMGESSVSADLFRLP